MCVCACVRVCVCACAGYTSATDISNGSANVMQPCIRIM